jgi:hypothetical protein
MVTIAASDFGDYLFLVIMLVFGLINWVANKLKEGKGAPPTPRAPRPAARQQPTRDAEEERMRRFLEALGVPQDEAPSPAPVAPRPAPVTSRPAPPPLPVEPPSLDAADTTDEPVEHIHIPELQTVPVREFETVSSRVSADADGDFVTVASGVSAVPDCARHPESGPMSATPTRLDGNVLLARLRSRHDVRTALILSEILGPPRSLRSSRN